MIGWNDQEVRAFDLKMRLLDAEHPTDGLQTFLQVEREVDAAKRDNVNIGHLRLASRVWQDIEEALRLVPGDNQRFGYEVEVVDEDADVIEVVVESAEVLAMAVA